jgi:hypothetical protein
MPELVITINDEAIDLNEGQAIAMTKQSARVGDFSTVLASGTNQITIPLTAKNKRIIDNAHILQTESDMLYNRMPVIMSQEGVETIQDGYAIFESVTKNSAQLQLVGGNANFFNRIKDLNLRDLPLTEYDHFWTNAEVFANRNNTAGFLYSLFEQGDSSAGNTLSTYGTNLYAVRTELLLPVFFIKTLIEKIYEEQGFNFDSGTLSALNMYNDAVVFAASTPNRGTDLSFMNLTIENTSPYSGIGSETALFDGNGVIVSQSSIYWQLGVNPAVSEYLVSDNATVHLVASFIMTNSDTVSSIGQLNIYYSSPDGITTLPIYFSIPVGTSTINIDETFDCVINPDGDCFFDLESIFLPTVDMEVGSTFAVDFEFLSNNLITTSDNYNFIRGVTPVPDMKQGDFLKEIAKIFQLIFDTDEVNATVVARRFDEIKDNIPSALDWSDKIDDTDFQMTMAIEGFAQTNKLTYQADDITGYTGEGFINVANENLDAEKKYVEVKQFAATSAVTRFDTVQAPNVPLFTLQDTINVPTNGMTDRILLVRQQTFGYNINFNRDGVDLPTTTVTFAYFTEPGNEDSLDFPTLITRFYQAMVDMTDSAKTINIKAKLFIGDVKNYSPFNPVYIEKFNAYFYLEKIENYIKNKLTNIKLIKL